VQISDAVAAFKAQAGAALSSVKSKSKGKKVRAPPAQSWGASSRGRLHRAQLSSARRQGLAVAGEASAQKCGKPAASGRA
jgi:hypothetical protein